MFSMAPHGKTIIMKLNYDDTNGSGWADLNPESVKEAQVRLSAFLKRYYTGPGLWDRDVQDFVAGQERNRLTLSVEGPNLRIFSKTVPNVIGAGRCHVYLDLPVAEKLSIYLASYGKPEVRKRVRGATAAPGAASVRKRTRNALPA